MLATACGARVSLDEVPIIGGTEAQRAIVREQLALFETWVGPGRVELRSIRFTPQPEPRGAAYSATSQRIELDTHLELESVASFVRHELCHALDYQNNLVSNSAAFEALIEALALEGTDIFRGERRSATKRTEEGEAMALFCEDGPAPSLLTQHTCAGDSSDFGPVGRFFAEEVWTGAPDLLPGELAGVEFTADYVAPFVPEVLLAIGGSEGRSIKLAVSRPREPGELPSDYQVSSWLDLQTGEEAQEGSYNTSGSYELDPSVPLPLGLVAPYPSGVVVPVHTVVQGEEALVVVDGANFRFWRLSPRLVSLREGQWRLASHCPGEVATVFHTPDALWVAWGQDERVQWARASGP